MGFKDKKLFIFFAQLFLFILLIIIIELFSFLALFMSQSPSEKAYKSFPEFISTMPAPFNNVDDFKEVELSYSRKASRCRGKIIYNSQIGFPKYEKDNFKCYGEELKNGLRHTIDQPANFSRRILIFGGSTVWGSGSSDKNTIPSIIQKKINKGINQKIKVINYGFTTVTINQQLNLLKSIKIDTNDIVIFYDGGNDIFQSMVNENPDGSIIGYNQSNKFNIFIQNLKFFLSNTSNTYKLMSSIKSKFNQNELQNCINEEEDESNVLINNGFEHYISKIKQANKYVINNGAEFFHFLQPSLFYKDNKYSEYEKKIIENSPLGINECKVYQERVNNGYEYFSKNYNTSLKNLNSNNLINILDPVQTKEEYYLDNLHISSAGNKIIAEEIYKVLLTTLK
tara:strand:- start:13178 stop:14368 length:1191 start_codon:yes stop_codon:yes gene_type:complete